MRGEFEEFAQLGATCEALRTKSRESELFINGSVCVNKDCGSVCARAQIEGVRCDTVLPKSTDVRDTCIRPREVIAIARVMMVARVHSTASEPAQLAAQSAAAAGGLALCLPCHLAWAEKDTLEGPGKDTLGTPVPTQWRGREWPALAAQPTCTQLRAGPSEQVLDKHGGGAMSIQGKSVECARGSMTKTSMR